MKVIYTEEAIADLDEITDFVALHYPTIGPAVRARLHAVVTHLSVGRRRRAAPVDGPAYA